MNKHLKEILGDYFGEHRVSLDEHRDLYAKISTRLDEIDSERAMLQKALATVSEELSTANAELLREHGDLETRVAERTRELLEANVALQEQVANHDRAVAALRESEHRFRMLAESSLVGVFQSNAKGQCVYVNPFGCELVGGDPNDMLGDGWFGVLHPEDRAEAIQSMLANLDQPQGFTETRVTRADGSSVWISVTAAALRAGSGELTGFIGTFAEITERHLIEETLRKSEERYRTLFEESRDVIYVSTPEGRLVDINPAGVKMFGFSSKDEMIKVDIGRDLYVRMADREAMLGELTEHGFIKDYEFEVQRTDGSTVAVLATTSAVYDRGGRITAFRGTLRDVTEKRQLQRQLRHAQKLEAIGRLAGGVAHDFNNLLTAIVGYGELLSMELGPQAGPATGHINEIKQAAQRGADLTRQLLAFSRQQILKPVPLDLNKVLAGTESLLRRVLGSDVELDIHCAEEHAPVMADPTQLEQVILNLAINSRDAMPEGGRLLLRTKSVEMRDDGVFPQPADGLSSSIQLEVTDTGHGIEESIMDQIFEPFFTTKTGGKGTGLGLATVYGIVRQSGGHIDVDSEVGSGTTFRIWLPRTEHIIEEVPDASGFEESPSGSGTILLVEDDPAVNSYLTTFLANKGYTVLRAEHGQDALDMSEREDVEFDLLLSDVVMPKLNGIELATRLRRRDPELKILLISGYSDRFGQAGRDPARLIEFELLQKPFSTDQLARRVYRALHGEPTAETSGTQPASTDTG